MKAKLLICIILFCQCAIAQEKYDGALSLLFNQFYKASEDSCLKILGTNGYTLINKRKEGLSSIYTFGVAKPFPAGDFGADSCYYTLTFNPKIKLNSLADSINSVTHSVIFMYKSQTPAEHDLKHILNMFGLGKNEMDGKAYRKTVLLKLNRDWIYYPYGLLILYEEPKPFKIYKRIITIRYSN